jgi:hypothetical protein
MVQLLRQIDRDGIVLTQDTLFGDLNVKLSDLKTTGILRADGSGIKDFEIKDQNSNKYLAVREGQKYLIGSDGKKRTLKECKQLVCDDAVVFFDDSVEESDLVDDLANALFGESKSLWQSVHPAAILVLIRSGVDVPEAVINETLSSYGYDTDDALADAKQVYEHHTNETL